MSAVELAPPPDQTELEPAVGYVGDGWVEADNLRARDPQLVAAAEQLQSAEEIGMLCQTAFELGVSVWTLSQSRQISTDLSDEIDRFRSEVHAATTDAVNAIGQEVAAVVEPDTGVLASAVEREAAGLKQAVAEAFDANDKSSALSQIEQSVSNVAAASRTQTVDAIRQVLNPSAGSGPLVDLRETIVREVSSPLEQVTATVGQLKEMVAADEARRAERARGTAQGGDYEAAVAELLAEMGQSCGDVVMETGAETGTLGTSKVGDHVVEVAAGDGSYVRIVFESKKRKKITMQKIRDELDTAAANRDATVALMVLSSEDCAPNRMPFQRVGIGRYVVVYSEDTGDTLALRVAYQQARADALTLHSAERGGDAPSIDLEALRARIGEACALLDTTSRIAAGIRKAQSSLDATLQLGEKMRADILETLDKCQALISVPADK
jgi:hypothetical protein